MIRPHPIFQVYLSEKTAANLIIAAHRYPQSALKGITTRKFGNPFSTAC